ncbi:MAG: hypothetical protein U0232_28730 [Thermomicrobiales bacterium]
MAHTRPVAILLAGSAATGEVDCFADLDLLCYYEAMPPEARFRAARERWRGATGVRHDPWNEVGIGEVCAIDGVEVQVGHFLVGAVERDIAAVTEVFSTDAVLHKKILGLVEGRALHGEAVIARWQGRLAEYPDGLAWAMVEQHLRGIFPVWYYREHLARRDAELWWRQALVEGALHILGVLAGLNRRYFSAMQLKRTRALVAAMPIAPAQIVGRLEQLLSVDVVEATERIEGIVREVLELVVRWMPEANIAVMLRQPGEREKRWEVPRA